MEANHKRHHEFLCDPSFFYEGERLNFAFGSSYFTTSVSIHKHFNIFKSKYITESFVHVVCVSLINLIQYVTLTVPKDFTSSTVRWSNVRFLAESSSELF